jgi:outer membrane protein
MKRILKIAGIAIFGLVVFCGDASAQQIKIGVVQLGRLINESPQSGEAMKALEEEFAARQREIVARQNGFKEKRAQVERDLEVMGPEERRNAERDLVKEERDLARTQQEFTEDINLRRNEELGKLQRELLRQVQKFASEAGYDLVLSEGVFYASPSIDVTEQVLSGMKASFSGGQPAN